MQKGRQMTRYNITLDSEDVQDLFSSDEGVSRLMEKVANQVLDQQATEQIGAEKYERSESRRGYRSGYRSRFIKTRVGRLELRVPRLRDGQFDTEMFGRLQRSEQAFLLAIIEMVINGVSTRKVSKVVEEMCGMEFPKSSVSDLCKRLDPIVTGWNERALGGNIYPFLVLDALYIRVRDAGRVRSYGVLIGTGVRDDGKRDILGLQLRQTESEVSWEEFLRWLVGRGLSGVDLVVSDNHAGLVKAIRSQLPGSSWQHCQTHLMRNILDSSPKRLQKELHSRIRLVFDAPDEETARELASDVISRIVAPKAISKLEEHLDDALAVMALPEKYRKRLRTSNSIERLNQEIRRRERAIRIFPNQASAFRLIGALLLEQDEVWTEGRKYLDMEEYRDWMESLESSDDVADSVLNKAHEFAH
jgi:putative transposase